MKKLIAANVLVDAFAMSLTAAGIGYLSSEADNVDPSDTLTVVGLSLLCGTAVSLVLSSLSDAFGVRRMLAAVQVCQIVAFILLVPCSDGVAFLVTVGFIFFLGRMVSPLRGSLPPKYLAKNELLTFKSGLRSYTLSVVLVGSAIISLLTWAELGVTRSIALVGALCYCVCLAATLGLPKDHAEPGRWDKVTSPFRALRKDEWLTWLKVLLVLSVVAVSGSAVPYVIAQRGPEAAWLLLASSLIGIAVNEIVRQVSKRTLLRDGQLLNSDEILGAAVILALMAIGVVLFAGQGALSVWVFVGAVLAVSALENFASTLTTLVAWEAQYSSGEEKNRTSIVALFSVSGAVGAGFGQLVGGSLFRLAL